ncbi:MAG TPA: elongation factor Ts [Gammaproteobacteria bacterium]|nr:elongation factor Ts [Gammaproteobacteria bacterium]MEC8012002.1 translation elongation factor Ts [Pseudomonadota bacterium]HCK92760.1 elongation factor Ts [Gammaproteobacteria bacterium]|tara:strand:+ start:52 stop:915 length:864 start_codon:yes stop_codon:yes gene_type:complete
MSVTAAQVKELRERTGLGMMECKKALVEANADIDLAIENLRKSGQAKAAKKASRTAAEGAVVAKVGEGIAILLEVNSETDFVARDDNFQAFVNQVAEVALAARLEDVAKIAEIEYTAGQTVEEARLALVQKIGENIQLRRAQLVEGNTLGAYIHNSKIGVLVSLEGGDGELAKDVAMHVAAVNPLVATPDEVSAAVLDKEREIFTEQARQSGKPEEVIQKMIDGRLKKFLSEVSLVDQAFVKNPDVKVGQLLKEANATINSFTRMEVGEGIEKEVVDFAAEVAAAAK